MYVMILHNNMLFSFHFPFLHCEIDALCHHFNKAFMYVCVYVCMYVIRISCRMTQIHLLRFIVFKSSCLW